VAFDLEEQEKLAELKAWWSRYGNLVTALIFLAALSVLGVNGYNAWQTKKSGEASMVYDQMDKAIAAKNATLIKETAATLMSDFWFKRTAYAQMAALEAARYNVDAGDLKSAEAQLQWAADQSVPAGCALAPGERSDRSGRSRCSAQDARRRYPRPVHICFRRPAWRYLSGPEQNR
jgi:predicted negative regulator of RcsB-dependent stress response